MTVEEVGMEMGEQQQQQQQQQNSKQTKQAIISFDEYCFWLNIYVSHNSRTINTVILLMFFRCFEKEKKKKNNLITS